MTGAQLNLLAIWRRRGTPTPADRVADIHSLPELDAYRRQLSLSGDLTAEQMSAIRDRQDALQTGRG